MPAGHCGAWPGTESTHRAAHQRPGATVWRAPEGPEGTGGLRGAAPNAVRSPSLAGGRAQRRPERQRSHRHQAQSRIPADAGVKGVRGPGCGARNTSGATSIKLNREFRLHRRCEGRKRAWLRHRNNSGAASNKLNRKFRLHRRCEGRQRARPQRPWAAAEPGRAPSQRTEPHISDQAPLCGGRRRDRRARAGFEARRRTK